MNLVIVESPTKAKTIGKFLPKSYKVESSYGHVRDLPKSKLGIDLEHDFEPQYIIPTRAKKIVTGLKKLAAKSDKVVLATDGDREGEAIAWHLTEALGIRSQKLDARSQKQEIQPPTPNLQPPKVERIVFHEITERAIEDALKHPRAIDQHLVDAQQGRRVLDRLVGYKLSPFLWKKVARGLSAGRVQSVAVRLIVEREEEIQKFKSDEYWTITAALRKESGETLEADLSKINNKALEKLDLKNKAAAEEIVKDLEGAAFRVSEVEKKSVKRNPSPPFITSTLQQTASQRLGFSAKKTMLIAQHLYEKGLITYMRTDSVNLSQESLIAAKEWLSKELGDRYGSQAPRTFTTKSRLAQEAHEAIRPTNVYQSPENVEDVDEQKLYELIWSRFLASQMPQAEFDATQIDIETRDKRQENRVYTFHASGSVLTFDGFLKIWEQKLTENKLPLLSKEEILQVQSILPAQHFTEPPPRYSEAALIKTLEEYGIGRPSTYAPTISVIQERNYVQKQAGKFSPTEIGALVTKILKENFPEIVDADFTAKMESYLDEIAANQKDWRQVIKEFYVPFAENLQKKYEEVSKIDFAKDEPPTGINCEKCGKPMVVKFGRFGKFLACSGFPDCKTTKQIREEPKKIGLKCPKCLASPDPAKRDQPGDVVEKRVTRGRARGKLFWGCERYPQCDYASWTNPMASPTEEPKNIET